MWVRPVEVSTPLSTWRTYDVREGKSMSFRVQIQALPLSSVTLG